LSEGILYKQSASTQDHGSSLYELR